MKNASTEDLVVRYREGDLDRDEFDALQEQLRADPETKQLFIEHALLDHALDQLAGEIPAARGGGRDRGTSRIRVRRQASLALAVAAACLLVGAFIAWFIQVRQRPAHAAIRFSANSTWSLSGEGGSSDDARLPFGQTLLIDTGAVEFQPLDGITAVVEAPARLVLVDGKTLRLEKGRGSFVVSHGIGGFAVVTPRMEVVDLGTEFAVVSGWGPVDQAHVINGSVSVSGSTATASRVLRKGDAVSVDGEGTIEPIDAEKELFQRTLPAAVEILAVDDFEIDGAEDGMIMRGEIPGWRRLGSVGNAGRFNPAGRGRYYNLPEMVDDAGQGGVCHGMKGPCLGYFYGIREGGLEREVGEILPRSVYTVTIHLGVRGNEGVYAGYAISLVSGETILQTTSSSEPPCGKNEFRAVTMAWNSENRPKGVQPGDPLSVRISPDPVSTGKPNTPKYLDFDNFQITVSSPAK